jgi:hypothetical protein
MVLIKIHEVKMANQIRRNNWRRFFRKFNSANQYRRTEIRITQNGNENEPIPVSPFMGIALKKRGRLIDGIQFFSGGWNASEVAQPVVTLKDPSQIWLEKDNTGRDNQLRIKSSDGTEISLALYGEPQIEQERSLVEKVAYSMFEHRGYWHGNDMGDWLEAEQRIKQIEIQLTQ